MVRVDLIRDKVRRLREVVENLRARLPAKGAPIAADADLRDLVAFRVYLGIQEAIDVCSHVIADEGWGPAPSLRDHFQILAKHGVLPQELAASLADGVKVRNVIAHGYADVDPEKLHAAASALLRLLEQFAAAVLQFAETRARS